MAKTPSKKKRAIVRPERIDRRFMPQATASTPLLGALGVVGALVLGAGVWGQFGHQYNDVPPYEHAFWLLTAGAVLLAAALWFSTSNDPAIRVGVPGIAMERGGVRRIPWHALSEISWASGDEALVIAGADEAAAGFTFRVRARAHPSACARILAEAAERMPTKLEVPEAVRERFGAPDDAAGLKLVEPLQLVGKRCVKSSKLIAYEPDARICPRCERVYHKRTTPRACACGQDLSDQRDAVGFDEDDDFDGEPLPS